LTVVENGRRICLEGRRKHPQSRYFDCEIRYIDFEGSQRKNFVNGFIVLFSLGIANSAVQSQNMERRMEATRLEDIERMATTRFEDIQRMEKFVM
jgi:hypothetical protein